MTGRPRCKRREAALAKLAAFRAEHPDQPVPRPLLTYNDPLGIRRYTVSGHDVRKRSLSAAERYAASLIRARRNEIRLRLALEAARMISFDWDILEDRVRRLDPETLDLATPGPYLNFDAVLNAVHAADRQRFLCDIERALTSPEGVFASDVRVLNLDGSMSRYSERGRVERDPQGRPVRLIGVAVEIGRLGPA
jgi:PAS domain-containing protein